MLSRDEMTELFTAYTLVPFGGTAATFSKDISCHSAWTWDHHSPTVCPQCQARVTLASSGLAVQLQRMMTRASPAQLPQMASCLIVYCPVEVLRWLCKVVSSEAPWKGEALSLRMIGSLFPYFQYFIFIMLLSCIQQLLVLYDIVLSALFNFPLKYYTGNEFCCNITACSLSKWAMLVELIGLNV